MKFLLFCEGETEERGLPAFLKRYLDTHLEQRVGMKAVKFRGWSDLYKNAKRKAHLRLKEDDVIAVISLLDLYGPTFFPGDVTSAGDRCSWAKNHIEKLVDHAQFYQFFAVHEVEAWLLSNPNLFPPDVRKGFPGSISNPETVNFDEPPAKLLDRLYKEKTRRGYKKVTYGKQLFSKLDVDVAKGKCPRLAEMLDRMVELAKGASH